MPSPSEAVQPSPELLADFCEHVVGTRLIPRARDQEGEDLRTVSANGLRGSVVEASGVEERPQLLLDLLARFPCALIVRHRSEYTRASAREIREHASETGVSHRAAAPGEETAHPIKCETPALPSDGGHKPSINQRSPSS